MLMANVSVLLSVIVTLFNGVSTQWQMYSDVGKTCISHLNSNGVCTPRSKCPYEKDARIFFVPVNFIRCNAVSVETVVCCPKEKFWPMPSNVPKRFEEGRPPVEEPQRRIAEEEDHSCISHLNSNGVCTPRSKCLYSLYARNVHATVNFTKCNSENTETDVCCPKEKFLPRPAKTPKRFKGPKHSLQRLQWRKVKKVCRIYRETEKQLLSSYQLRGTEVERNEFPHMAALGYTMNDDKDLGWLCGGSLISKRFVLTTAHCIENREELKPVVVRLGVTHLLSTEENYGEKKNYIVRDYWTHPLFKTDVNYNDVGLVYLAEEVKYSLNVLPACLATPDITSRLSRGGSNTELIATGWGSSSLTENAPGEKLHKEKLTLIPLERCRQSVPNDSAIPHGIVESMLCAKHPKGKIATCMGDAGGPLQIHEVPDSSIYTIVGVTSFGPMPCGGHIPSVFSKVSSHLEWIMGKVWH